MDHQEDFCVPSRAEYIKLARESCTRNLNAQGLNNKNNSKIKDENKNIKGLLKKGAPVDYYSFTQGEFDVPSSSIKFFAIRVICAFMLFLTVFIIDKLNIEFRGISSKSIKQLVASNQGVEDAENFLVSLFDKEKVKENNNGDSKLESNDTGAPNENDENKRE